jgi:hypothetical protein
MCFAKAKIMLLCKNAKINPNLKSKWACVMTYDFAIKEYANEKSPNKIGSSLNLK